MREPLERGVAIMSRISLKMSMALRPRPRSFVPPRKIVRWGGWVVFEGEEPGRIFSGKYANASRVNMFKNEFHRTSKRRKEYNEHQTSG